MNGTWTWIFQYISDFLAVCLIARLLLLRFQSVYPLFCLFVGFDAAVSITIKAISVLGQPIDYRIEWLVVRAISWTIALLMVYALLSAILKTLPGLLRFSRYVLNSVLVGAILIALLTVNPEYTVLGVAREMDQVQRALMVGVVLDRAFSMAVVLALLAILAFVLWFPVRMPRNLAILSFGLVIYFSSITAFLLIRTYLSPGSVDLVSNSITIIQSACCLYWTVFITSAGEAAEVRIGHSWRREDQERLIGQLESMNAALLRAAARH